MNENPSRQDLLAVAAFASRFEAPDFVVGRYFVGSAVEEGVISMGGWEHSPTVLEWVQALYDHHIIDPECDYTSEENREITRRVFEEDPSMVDSFDLRALRMLLTAIARSDRFCWGSGLYEDAFRLGIAQAATRRLGDLAEEP